MEHIEFERLERTAARALNMSRGANLLGMFNLSKVLMEMHDDITESITDIKHALDHQVIRD